MKKEFQNIELSESYILGWKIVSNTLTLFVELLLSSFHKDFISFDSTTQFGCYKIGLIKFYGVNNLSGLDQKVLLPKWEENLCEYSDVYEINSFEFENSGIKIEVDERVITFKYNKFNMKLLESERFEL